MLEAFGCSRSGRVNLEGCSKGACGVSSATAHLIVRTVRAVIYRTEAGGRAHTVLIEIETEIDTALKLSETKKPGHCLKESSVWT